MLRREASGRSMDTDVGDGAICDSCIGHLPGRGKTEVGTWLRPTEGLGPEPPRRWSRSHDKKLQIGRCQTNDFIHCTHDAPCLPLPTAQQRGDPGGLRYPQRDRGSDTSQSRGQLYHPRRLSWVVTEPAVSPQRQWPRALALCTPGPRRISSPRWIAFEHSPTQPCCALATTGRASQRWVR